MVHENLGELTPAIFRDLRQTPLTARWAAQSEFSLAARRWQGAMAGGALCLPPCPSRLPLLFPKISLRCDFREPYKMRAEGSMKIKPSLSSRASVEGSCLEQRAVPNTAKEFVFRYAPRKISPLGQSLLLLSSVEMTGRRDPFDCAAHIHSPLRVT